MIKENWTLEEINSLPNDEHDYFDRKSGKLLSQQNFREKLAQTFSAFANSGGGHIIIGLEDDGTINGVSKYFKGNTTTKDWLEQTIPNIVQPSPTKFRVHQVDLPNNENGEESVIIIIDVNDSYLAPFQSIYTKIYYQRVGSHSIPAPHFYLETLRNRINSPVLKAELINAKLFRVIFTEKTLFIQLLLTFDVKNYGNITPKHWFVDILNNDEKINGNGSIIKTNFPTPTRVFIQRTLPTAILPTRNHPFKEMLGFHFPRNIVVENGLPYAINMVINENVNLSATVITDMNICDSNAINIEIIKKALNKSTLESSVSVIEKKFSGNIGNGFNIINFAFSREPSSKTFIDFSGEIENINNEAAKELTLEIIFLDENNHLVEIHEHEIGRVNSSSKRYFEGSIQSLKILNAKYKEFYTFDRDDFNLH